MTMKIVDVQHFQDNKIMNEHVHYHHKQYLIQLVLVYQNLMKILLNQYPSKIHYQLVNNQLESE